MSVEEKKLYMRNKDAERKRKKRLEEKMAKNSLVAEDNIETKPRGKSLEHKVKDENSKESNNYILLKKKFSRYFTN
jgi:hypothetical protein